MIKPLADRIVVRPIEEESKTATGIVLPDTAKEKPQKGEVVAVGPGRMDDGKRVPMEVKVGDKVLYADWGPKTIKVDGEELLIVKEEDVLAVL